MSEANEKQMADLALLELQADFAINLLHETSLNTTVSSILSPLSIAVALSLAYAGAEGDTKKEFEEVFVKGQSYDAIHTFFQNTLGELSSKDSSNISLNLANRAYAAQNLEVKQTFKDIVTKYYGGEFEQVNFADSPTAVKKINDFVEKVTHDKIKNLVDSSVINEATRLVLVNAIYFKEDWQTKFRSQFTKDQKFFVAEGDEKNVPMMRTKAKFGYFENDEVQVLELPYVDNVTTFVAVLPKEKYGLSSVLSNLTGKQLLELKSKVSKTEVNVELPRFKIEKEFSLSEVLKKLGFVKGFSSQADFKGIAENEPLYISAVVHKAFIEVNEEGTEAAAATAVVHALNSPQFRNFRANHPFLYGIFVGAHPVFLGQFAA